MAQIAGGAGVGAYIPPPLVLSEREKAALWELICRRGLDLGGR